MRSIWLSTLVVVPCLGCGIDFCFQRVGDDPATHDDYETTLARWRAQAGESPDDFFLSSIIAVTCEDGIQVLKRGTHSGVTNYYDDAGSFIALTDFQDFNVFPCGSFVDWPRSVECKNGGVTEVISGGWHEVGDEWRK